MEHDRRIDCLRCLIASYGPDATMISQAMTKYLDTYIWEQDRLVLNSHKDTVCPWQPSLPIDSETEWMWSEINHCGNIEDEWFLAFLLSYITNVFKGEVMAQVFTNEGQFMLIEAANLLPSWVDCSRHGSIDEIAEGRVWIYNGLLHLIPLHGDGEEDFSPKSLTVSRAAHAVRGSTTSTLAPARIQEYLSKHHISRFPSAIFDICHRAKVCLPRSAAAVLMRHKDICASASRAFLDRTAPEMRATLNNSRFWPKSGVHSNLVMVTCIIQLRKSHYASLAASPFSAPKAWPRPPNESSAAHKQADLGVKLTIGLNILLHRSISEDPDCAAEHARFEKLPEWHRYTSALRSQGFFGDEVDGSAVHQRRCKDAEAAFRGSRIFADIQRRAAALLRDVQAAEDAPVTDAEVAHSVQGAEDSDSWMTDEFNSRLKTYTHGLGSNSPSHASSPPGEEMQTDEPADMSAVDIMDRLSRFFDSGATSAGARPNPASFSLNADRVLQALNGGERLRTSHADSEEESSVSSAETDEVPDESTETLDDESRRGHDSFMQAYMDQMQSEITKKSGRDSHVDVNMETVSNLLKSVTEGSDTQPGAAQGLFGMLGVSVPTNMNTDSTNAS